MIKSLLVAATSAKVTELTTVQNLEGSWVLLVCQPHRFHFCQTAYSQFEEHALALPEETQVGFIDS